MRNVLWSRRKKNRQDEIEKHRQDVLHAIELESTDTLAARLQFETDPKAMSMIVAALQERHSIQITLAHVHADHWEAIITPAVVVEVRGPETTEFDPFAEEE